MLRGRALSHQAQFVDLSKGDRENGLVRFSRGGFEEVINRSRSGQS